MRETLIEKLRPDRFSAMSGKMAAIVGYILDERFSDPAISELVVTSDGFVQPEVAGHWIDQSNGGVIKVAFASGAAGPTVRPYSRCP